MFWKWDVLCQISLVGIDTQVAEYKWSHYKLILQFIIYTIHNKSKEEECNY